MKLRNFIIVLFALLMVFAFASCKNEPEVPQPKPDDPTGKIEHPIYQIVVDEGVEVDYYGRDKIKLRWTDVEVNSGSVISLKYRSERGIYEWDIRDEASGIKWVYETQKNGFVDPVQGEDGWYTLTYTITDTLVAGEPDYPNDAIAVYFRGRFAQGDVFEIKDVTLDGKPLAVASGTVISKAHLEGGGAIEDHEWTIPENYVYLLAMGSLGSVDKNPIIAKVAPNAAVDLSKIPEKENYKIHIYSDSAFANELAETAPVTKDATIIYYKYVGDPRLVTIDLNGGAADPAIENIKAEYGSPIAKPKTIPTIEGGKLFAGWYKNLTDEAPYEFSTAVEDNFTLYAKYTDPVTVHFNTGDGNAVADAIIASGTSVDQPEDDPTYPANLYMFAGWFVDPECTIDYDWSTIITAETTIYAKWVDAKRVTFNLNYEGAPEATVIGVDTGSEATEPEKIPMRSGWVFDGWYTEAECTNEYDFDTAVTADTPLFAKWTYGTMYKVTATKFTEGYNHDKFVLGFADAKVKAGDEISISYRSTEDFTWFSIRKNDPSTYSKWFHEKSSGEWPLFFSSKTTGEDGWTTVTYEFPEPTDSTQAKQIGYGDDGTGFFVYLGNSKMVPGAFAEFRAVTINGVEVEFTDATINHELTQTAPTWEVVETPYEWTDQAVKFNTDGGTVIADASVAFGKRASRPDEDPVKAGVIFIDWYADAEFTTVFDFKNTPITQETTIYARYGAPIEVTFNSQGGSAVDPVTVPSGTPVAKPEDPILEGKFFSGWFTDPDCTKAYNFSDDVTEAITLYAQWADPINLTYDLNYTGAANPTVIGVGGGLALTAPKNPSRVGYFFGGWYKEAECTTVFDFAAGITEETTLYAKWEAPTKEYKYTATKDSDRFQYRFKSSSVSMLKDYEAGDVVTFMVKFTPVDGSAAPTKYRLRSANESTVFANKIAFGSADGDGWISVTIVFAEGLTFTNDGLLLGLEGSVKTGDVAEIKALAFNGKEIPISTTSTSSGAYEGAAPTVEVIDL